MSGIGYERLSISALVPIAILLAVFGVVTAATLTSLNLNTTGNLNLTAGLRVIDVNGTEVHTINWGTFTYSTPEKVFIGKLENIGDVPLNVVMITGNWSSEAGYLEYISVTSNIGNPQFIPAHNSTYLEITTTLNMEMPLPLNDTFHFDIAFIGDSGGPV